jgi:hypothetical protein
MGWTAEGGRVPRSLTLDARVARRRNRWRRLNRTLSAGVGALAVGTGIYLGVTGPSSSPVLPGAAPAATAAPSAPAAGTAAGTGAGADTGAGTTIAPADGGRDRGADGGGRRVHMADFDGHHR